MQALTDPLQVEGMVLSVTADGVTRLDLGSDRGERTLRLDLPPRGEVGALAPLGDREGREGREGREWIAAGSAPGPADEPGRRLFLLEGDPDGSRLVPPPASQQGRERRNPVLLVENGTLAGLAWLEGDSDASLSVRAAVWDGRAWQAPEIVAAPGPGSRTALTGAVLDDGSWLLAWSAFDGEDDEIVWSRRSGAVWSRVSAVSADDNRVPDVTPVIAGNLIAWSRYDGVGYRLRTARFDPSGAGRWRDERFAGPTHSMYPSFVREDDHLFLVYLNGRPRAWSVQELSPATGRALRSASALSGLEERPIVSGAGEGSRLRLRWPGAKWEAAADWTEGPAAPGKDRTP